jgi:Oxygenase domain of the 2OGFeDO superfamily
MTRAPRSKPRAKNPSRNQKRRLLYSQLNPFNAVEIKLLDVPPLGALRQNFSPQNGATPDPSLLSTFSTVPLSSERHTIIVGKDGGLLGYHIPASHFASVVTPEFTETLVCLLKDLPPVPIKHNMENRRQIPQTRTYMASRGCRSEDVLKFSSQYVKDNEKGGKGRAFVQHCTPLWETIGTLYKSLWPKAFRDMTHTEILPDHVAPLAYPFMSLTINIGSIESPVVSQPHCDVGDAFYGVSCLYTFGKFTGGELVLWELKRIVPLKSGDVFLFPAHLITHSNTSVVGERHSLVAYTKEEILKYYCRHNEKPLIGSKQIRTRLKV